MDSSMNFQNEDLHQIDEKSDSTMAIDLGPTIGPRLRTNPSDTNSQSSRFVQENYSRKRSASRDSFNDHQYRTEISSFVNKKQRNLLDSHSPQISVPKSHEFSFDQPRLQNVLVPRSTSVEDASEHLLDWLKDFMHRSMNTIRESVVQACLTALEQQQHRLSRISAADINVNHHRLTAFRSSEHSLTSHQTEPSWRQLPSPIRPSMEDRLHQHHPDNTIRKIRIHHRARSQTYPMFQHIRRVPVMDLQVPWTKDWPEYHPTMFTADQIYMNSGADPDLLKSSTLTSISLNFNSIDGAVDRRSVYRPYEIRPSDGLPLNPIGRTGLQGRGILLRWGPNIYHYVLLCRWKRDAQGNILVHPTNGKRILQILLEIQGDGYDINNLILTGGLKMLGHRFPPQLQDRLRRFLVQTGKIFDDPRQILLSLNALDHLFDRCPTAWKGAYFDDARNTDNAWIELSIEYLFDHNDEFLSSIPSLNYEQLIQLDQPRFIWKDVRQNLDIGPRTHYRLIENLAYKFNAFF